MNTLPLTLSLKVIPYTSQKILVLEEESHQKATALV
jgi:hypothetical protein